MERLRKPDAFREISQEEEGRRLDVLFVGDRNVGSTLRNRLSENVNFKSMATTAGGMAEAKKHNVVLIHLGAKEDAKERFAFLHMLLKEEDPPALALLFLKSAPDQIRNFCIKQGEAIVESTNSNEVEKILLGLMWPRSWGSIARTAEADSGRAPSKTSHLA